MTVLTRETVQLQHDPPTSSPDRDTTDKHAIVRLPSPPNDLERDSYLGNQYRWIGPAAYTGFLLIVCSLVLFVGHRLWSVFLLIPLSVSLIGATVSLATSSRGRRFDLAAHRAVVDAWRPGAHPSVDVFLPSAGEDLAVLENTYQHVAALRWPGPLRVLVLDDSGREQVADLAAEYGFDYTVRENRGHLKKAGNLRHGYENSDGDLIAIFDADFVPRPDYLFELVPYFDDSGVGIVQSPQYFDVDSGMNWLQRGAGATQILFYRWVQPSRDRFDAAICVGTCAIYRRTALVVAGGFAQIGHSEDVHTGVNVLTSGHVLRYVPTVVSKGLCPDGFDQFVTQQYRWCTGSMSLLFSTRFHRTRLQPMQRLCFWSGFLYYITTAVNVFAMSIPPVLMGYFAADKVRPSNYVFVALALMCRQATIPVITADSESLLGLTRIQSTYSYAHALALWDVLRGRTDSWVATGNKLRSRTAVRVARLARTWAIGTQVLLWSAIVIDVPRYGIVNFWPMIVFALLNLFVNYPIILADASVSVQPAVLRRWANRTPVGAGR